MGYLLLIERHSLVVDLFADNIQIETSILPQHVHSAITSVETCISDIINLQKILGFYFRDDIGIDAYVQGICRKASNDIH